MSDGEPEEEEPPPPAKKRRRRRRPEPAPEYAPPLESAPAKRSTGSDRWLVIFTGVLPWFLWKKVFAAPPPPEDDDGIPAFARAFPSEPALDALVAAFEAGDYARVRREAPALARQTDDEAVRAAARELRRRLDPDPLAVYLLGAAALLLLFLAGWYWAHPHTP